MLPNAKRKAQFSALDDIDKGLDEVDAEAIRRHKGSDTHSDDKSGSLHQDKSPPEDGEEDGSTQDAEDVDEGPESGPPDAEDKAEGEDDSEESDDSSFINELKSMASSGNPHSKNVLSLLGHGKKGSKDEED